MTQKEQVKYLLNKYPDTRSSDILLIYMFLKSHGLTLSDDQVKQLQEICKETMSLYDLIRYRQKIQSKGECLGTPEIMATRKKKGAARRKKEREEKYNIVKPTRIPQWYTDSLGNRELL